MQVSLCTSLLALVGHSQTSDFNFDQVLLWPYPSDADLKVMNPGLPVILSENSNSESALDFSIDSSADFEIVQKGVQRYQLIMFGENVPKDTSQLPYGLRSVSISLTGGSGSNPPLDLGVDESYTLILPDSDNALGIAKISAVTVWGALRALETLSQSIVFNYEAGSLAM